MEDKTRDPEDGMARLTQEATNQSTPDKSLDDDEGRDAKKLRVAPKRDKAPEAD